MFIHSVVLVCSPFISGAITTAPVQTLPQPAVVLAMADKEDGTISAVDAARSMFTLHTKAGDLEIRVSEKTAYTLDGKDSTMAEALKAGRSAKVTHKDKLATRVDVSTS